jgi:S1-C subfamily serine protease
MGLLGNLRIPLGADYVLAIGDTPIRTRQDLTVLLETRHRVGDVVDVSLWRDGNVIQVPVELGPRPE